ncbi:MAG: glycosyltransferase family 4 protein [Planctomycetota bacterium]
MRILLLTHGLPPESVGGVEQHVEGLADALARAGHDVHVFARSGAAGHAQGAVVPPPDAGANPRVTRAIYRWEGLTGLDSIYECAPMAQSLRRFLADCAARGETFDVAHVHHLTGLSTDALAVLREAGVPRVLTLHDYWLMCPRGQMWHRREEVCAQVEPQRCGECLHLTFGHWVSPASGPAEATRLHDRARATLKDATRLVVPSARVIPAFAALGVDPTRFTVVANGVDTEALHALPLPSCGPGPLRLGYLGTLIPSKGLHVLLAAVARQPRGSVELRVHGNAVPYHGDTGYLTRCMGLLEPGGAVTFFGPYTTQDLPRILRAVDVVCAPALWHEAFGLTVREAQAAQRPVLVSRIGGLQDAVTDGHEGLVLPPGDVDAWSAAIERLRQDRAAVRAMAGRSRPRARGFADMAADLVAVYRAAAAEAAAQTTGPDHRA